MVCAPCVGGCVCRVAATGLGARANRQLFLKEQTEKKKSETKTKSTKHCCCLLPTYTVPVHPCIKTAILQVTLLQNLNRRRRVDALSIGHFKLLRNMPGAGGGGLCLRGACGGSNSTTSIPDNPGDAVDITGATVLGMVASTQAFHLPMKVKTNHASRSSTSLASAISDAEAKASLIAIGGYDVETGGKPLDPLNLAKYIPAETLRKYETVHCRVAMLACIGYAFPQIFGMFDATDVQSANGIEALFQTAPEAWAQIIGACGIVEAAQWKHQQSGETTPFYDPFKGWPQSEKQQEKMKMRELKNGRAAMLCWASFISAALIPGSVPDFAIPF